MKKYTAKNYTITLHYADYAPFLFFLKRGWVPAAIKGKREYGSETIQLSLNLPLEFDTALVPQMWEEWKEENLVNEYATLN